MRAFWRFVPEAALMLTAVYASLLLPRWVKPSGTVRAASYVSVAFLVAGLLLNAAAIGNASIAFDLMNVRGAALAWAICACNLLGVAWIWRRLERRPFSARRRLAIRVAAAAAMAAPAAVTAFGIVGRDKFRLVEVDVPIAGLPQDLHHLRIAQLSDIHLSPFLSRGELRRCVDMANETKPHIAFVTGDLVTGSYDPVDDCLEELRRLRSDAGTFGCMGNHETYIGGEAYVKEHAARRGMRFLRGERTALRFGEAKLNLAGVDYQPKAQPYLRGAQRMLAPGEFNLLLSHNPDVFRVAREQGWNLTLAGHTHGGQINVEILEQDLNLVRVFVTPYVYGLYQEGGKSIYVTRGIGTVGVPARFGAPPEVALIRLCAT